MTRHVLFLGHNVEDAAVQRRISGLKAQNLKVTAFGYQRGNVNASGLNSLGLAKDGSLNARILNIRDALTILKNANLENSGIDIIYARNLDLALVGMSFAQGLAGRVRLCYEVLDLHPVLTAGGIKGNLARWLERKVLNNALGLVTSSPDFLRNYFNPIQKYKGETFLFENKVERLVRLHNTTLNPLKVNDPVNIVFSGKLRCGFSFEILKELAQARPETVRIRLAGSPLPELQSLYETLASEPNVETTGHYEYPDGLAAIYQGADLNWTIDYQSDINACALLPNRLYEGALFSVPPLVRKGTATAAKAAEWRVGIELDEPIMQNLLQLIDGPRDAILDSRSRLKCLPDSYFCVTDEYFRLEDFLYDPAFPK